MSIDRAAEIMPQSAPVEIANYPEIDDQMALVSDAFDSLERARETLKEAEKAAKDAIENLCCQLRLEESSMSGEEKQRLLSHVYWTDRRFAGPVKKLCGYCFKPDPAALHFTCQGCGNQAEGVVATWTEADSYRAYFAASVCVECRRRKEEEHAKFWEERYADWQRYEEMVSTLRNMPYSDYLMTDHWRQVRECALHREL